MFPSTRKPTTHISPNTLNTWIKHTGAAIGILDMHPHRLRHTCLATMNDNIGDLRAVATFAGHSHNSLNVTAGYTNTHNKKLIQMASTLPRPKRRDPDSKGGTQPSESHPHNDTTPTKTWKP
jgi:integrase